MVASDAIIACDEGLLDEIDHDKAARRSPDGTARPRRISFEGTLTPGGVNCFIPQIVYSTTFGYRTDVNEWGGNKPTTIKPTSST